VRKISKPEEIVPALNGWLKMRETPMNKTESSLLPLRSKISPPTILNFEYHDAEQVDGDKGITNTAGKKERLFSDSSRSISSSKYEPSSSERCLTPPFTPPANNESRGNFTQSFLSRRPSEHFLEVLEAHKQGQTLPKVLSATSLPPLRKPIHGEADSSERTPGVTKIAVSGSVCNGAFSRPAECCESQLLLVSGERKGSITPNHANGKILRKTNSLPLIKTCSALTNGLVDLNGSFFQNRTKSAVFKQEKTQDESERTRSPFDGNLEEINDIIEVFDEDEEDQDLEKFSMICQWLKECEEAQVT